LKFAYLFLLRAEGLVRDGPRRGSFVVQLTAQDVREKLKWIRRAADGGHATAQLIMGISCRTGRDMPQNLVEAYKWLSLAASREPADQNRTTAIHECEATAAQMTPAQLAEAQRLARAWIKARGV